MVGDSRTHGFLCGERLPNSSQHDQNSNTLHASDYLKAFWWSLTKAGAYADVSSRRFERNDE
jgi:hypothetical protein